MKRSIFGILVVVACMAIGSFAVQAYDLPTRVNITLEETVYRNVTYGASAIEWGEHTSSCIIQGVLNITNPSTDTEIFEIYVEFTNTLNMLTNFSLVSGRFGVQTNADLNNYTIEIPELLPGDYSSWEYNVSCLQVKPPLSIDTKYYGLNLGLDRKVLAGQNWTITQNVSNALDIGMDINNVRIEISTVGVWSNDTDPATLHNFTLLELLDPFRGSANDGANVAGTSNDFQWNWTPGGGIVGTTDEFNITYIVNAPDQVPVSGIYHALTERINYQVDYSTSNLSITRITAKGPASFKESKKIIQPADDDPNSTTVTWQADAEFSTSYNVSYVLRTISLWVTETLNPANTTTGFGPLSMTYNPDMLINKTGYWFTDASGTYDASWKFNFTDGSDASSPPPIVWMRPYFELVNGFNQIINSSFTRSGNDYYMKYVYVVNGYWLQVDKNVSNVGEDRYLVNVTVENIGNAWTPSGLTVTVYDFIPASFNWSLVEMSTAPNQVMAVASGAFNGTAIQWAIPRKSPYNSSLGPYTESVQNRVWTVEYFVNGTGEYRVSELYIVGLDPRQVDGAGSHEGITVMSGFMSGTKEMVYLLGMIALIGLNILNFIMTRRINRRLDK